MKKLLTLLLCLLLILSFCACQSGLQVTVAPSSTSSATPEPTPEPTPEREPTINPTDALQQLVALGWMADGATGQERTDAIFEFQKAAVASGLFPDVMVNGTLDEATKACLLSPDAPQKPVE